MLHFSQPPHSCFRSCRQASALESPELHQNPLKKFFKPKAMILLNPIDIKKKLANRSKPMKSLNKNVIKTWHTIEHTRAWQIPLQNCKTVQTTCLCSLLGESARKSCLRLRNSECLEKIPTSTVHNQYKHWWKPKNNKKHWLNMNPLHKNLSFQFVVLSTHHCVLLESFPPNKP